MKQATRTYLRQSRE